MLQTGKYIQTIFLIFNSLSDIPAIICKDVTSLQLQISRGWDPRLRIYLYRQGVQLYTDQPRVVNCQTWVFRLALLLWSHLGLFCCRHRWRRRREKACSLVIYLHASSAPPHASCIGYTHANCIHIRKPHPISASLALSKARAYTRCISAHAEYAEHNSSLAAIVHNNYTEKGIFISLQPDEIHNRISS